MGPLLPFLVSQKCERHIATFGSCISIVANASKVSEENNWKVHENTLKNTKSACVYVCVRACVRVCVRAHACWGS